ncbi:MAG: cellulose-binding protein, partial [Micromonosporaceae bacterium]|nr:cellulose-binding protein [Micromonosporaceae bacterium]
MIVDSGRSKIRSAVVVLAVAALTVAGAVTLASTTTAEAAAILVEDEGADCAVSLPGSVAANSKLPDPFKKL